MEELFDMQLPLGFDDFSTLFAVLSLILFVTQELIIPNMGSFNVVVDKGRMRKSSTVLGALFLFTVIVRVLQIMST